MSMLPPPVNLSWCKGKGVFELWDRDDPDCETLAKIVKIGPDWVLWLHFGESAEDDSGPYNLGHYSKPSIARAVAEGAYLFHHREEWERTQQALAVLDAQEGR